ncbi:nitroreductase family deazaflavin-dependent oxidoreductase [Nocardia abscessus]|uniref:nitroreductase family deazaflavin-dependent oxidoreductase n=1 Tax=Nocardia abscessus TaxID=120957 RepID=UPI002458A364|nr:nitroreductase family deazaflavin-dependent oxidoreductase [Nocardia abscessus]
MTNPPRAVCDPCFIGDGQQIKIRTQQLLGVESAGEGIVNTAQLNRAIIEQYRAGCAIAGIDRDALLLLTTVGRRSRRPHTVPLMFHREGVRLITIGGNLGADTHPDWYFNLTANPHVTVEVGFESYEAVAEILTGADREQVWATLQTTYPELVDQWARVARQIPVVALTRA